LKRGPPGGSEGDGEGRGGGRACEAEDQVVQLALGVFQIAGSYDWGRMLDHPHGLDYVVPGGVIDGPDEGLTEAVGANPRRIDAALFAGLNQNTVSLGAMKGPVASLPGLEEEFVGGRSVAKGVEVVPDRRPRLLIENYAPTFYAALLLPTAALEKGPSYSDLASHLARRGQNLPDGPTEDFSDAKPYTDPSLKQHGVAVAASGNEVGFED